MSIAIAIATGLVAAGISSGASPPAAATGEVLVAEVSRTSNLEGTAQYTSAFGLENADADLAVAGQQVADVVGAGFWKKISCIGCTAGILALGGSSLLGLALLMMSPVGTIVPACALACYQAFF